ncbi:hypothetical protein [Dendronalium sp. ChiSLP03b]|uniref:hypothetical protein n=1 Tax=Dendronalium sp. ChiSLP03b TaxID=3075381 RepID=UPI00391BEE6D
MHKMSQLNLLIRRGLSPYSLAATTLGAILTLPILPSPVPAQSTDGDRPTPLAEINLTGNVDKDNQSEYFYSFIADPGEITVRLDIQPNNANVLVGVDLFNSETKQLLSFEVPAYNSTSVREIQRVQIDRKQPIFIRIGRKQSNGSATYRVRIAGAVQPANSQQGTTTGSASSLNLPSQGMLRLEMDDGSIQEINLNRIRRATVRQ